MHGSHIACITIFILYLSTLLGRHVSNRATIGQRRASMAKNTYKALAERLSDQIHNGELRPDCKLPPHRKYQEQLNISLGIATWVYRELKDRGLVVGETGRGVFVRDQGVPLTLGVEQRAPDGLVDLVFNMPSSDGDPELLRTARRKIPTAGDLDAMLRYQPHAGRPPHERAIIADYLKDRIGKINSENLLVISGAQHELALSL
ncbi:GntR family transcriptional regulator [Breoghania sp.]|uniref:GntR family transcriptional regulator n=1 Tax=Breoghania sp. TaxID=2065378 RepID=UPI002611E27C|nr:GntR family transcriptional regulator [Breoghania sp.]